MEDQKCRIAAILIGITSLLLFAAAALPVTKVSSKDPLVVFLVRHAEKVDQSRDPELSPAGKERAAVLARVLRDGGIESIHSSDFIRTRKTAEPIATRLGLKVGLYDPYDLSALVEAIRKRGGRHLVVGHSNTIPKVVELLGGAPGPAINEAGDYDRLYIVTVGEDGVVSTVLLRYGEAFNGS